MRGWCGEGVVDSVRNINQSRIDCDKTVSVAIWQPGRMNNFSTKTLHNIMERMRDSNNI